MSEIKRDTSKYQAFLEIFFDARLPFFAHELPRDVQVFVMGCDLSQYNWKVMKENIETYPISDGVAKSLAKLFDKVEQAFIAFCGNQRDYDDAKQVLANQNLWNEIQHLAREILKRGFQRSPRSYWAK